ncbi:MAG: hypothetical protein OXH57_04850, partial [Ekhidna sp.]|nr:hypothetical protein [Ekhidna sp.]
KFIEIESGYRRNWDKDAKNFYAQCYSIINDRLAKRELEQRGEGSKDIKRLNEYLSEVRATHRTQWKKHYTL